MLESINHICFSVGNLNGSIHFYRDILLGKLLLTGKKTTYLELAGLWIALNEKKDISRNEVHFSYTHTAFTVDDDGFKYQHQRLKDNSVNILEGRARDIKGGRPIYFTDPNGYKLGLHAGTFGNRLNYYREARPRMTLYEQGVIIKRPLELR